MVSNPLLNRERESRRDYPREDGVEQIRVKEEPPDGKYFWFIYDDPYNDDWTMISNLYWNTKGFGTKRSIFLIEYENYPAQEEYEEYNNYDPDNIKYETEGEAHFQNEEY